MAYFPPTGSIVTYQITPSSNLGGASIFGQLPAGTAPLGSVATLQGTNPWIVTGSVQGFPTTQNISGSVVSYPLGTIITSLVSTIPSSVIVGASIFGLPPVNVTNTNLNVGGSVIAFEGAGWSGSVAATQIGTRITSVVSTVPSSVIVGTSIFGQLPAGTAPLGSVAVLQGTNPWNIAGSVAAFQAGTLITSISGAVGGSSSIYVMRNDAIASFLGADLTVRPAIGDSAGRVITKPFTSDDGTLIEYQGSVVSTSVTLIRASAIGLRNYVTDFLISNTGTVPTLVTFQDGSTSILARTISPAAGGSNASGINIPFKSARSQDLAFQAGTAVSVLYLTVRGYQSP